MDGYRWEHTPEWSLTSKLLISKHQQVQLLEAASILVSMNPLSSIEDNYGNPTPAVSTTSSGNSVNDNSSTSSGSEDTPPPVDQRVVDMDGGSSLPHRSSMRSRSGSKRYSASSGVGVHSSRSYSLHGHSSHGGHHHSTAPPPLLAGSVPTHVNPGSSFPSHFPNRQHPSRARSGSLVNTSRVAAAATASAGDEEGLAAAVELLSCSFGGPHSLSVSSPLTPRQHAPLLGPTTPVSSMTSPGGFLDQLRKQARTLASNNDVVMKIEETEEEEGGAHSHRGYYDGGMAHRSSSQHTSTADDEMAVDDESEGDDWDRRRGSGDSGSGRMNTRGMAALRRSRRSEEEEDGVFGKMEE